MVMFRDYFESAEDVVIARSRALEELRNHSVVDADEFFAALGDVEVYDAQDVLVWLGY
jgi:hypothetical protein